MGIGCRRDALEANVWYVRAAENGDERAKQRLATIQAAAVGDPVGVAKQKVTNGNNSGGKLKREKSKDCIVM